MQLNLSIHNLKPLSFNAAWRPFIMGKSARMIKSVKYKEYERALSIQLNTNFKEIREFSNYVKSNNIYIAASYRFYMTGVITKNKTVSKTCIDTSNAIKILEDVLFNYMGIDDSLCISVNAVKVESNEIRSEIELNCFDLNSIL